MTRRYATIAMALGLGACSPNSAGVGSSSNAVPGDGGTDDEGSSTAEAEGTSHGDGTGAAGGSTTRLDETAEGPAMDDGAAGHPDVTISHDPGFDFGPRNLTDNVEQAFTVANEGDADAEGLVVGGVDGQFSIRGHDCDATLAPGATCAVQVRFDPDLFGDAQTSLEIAYQDQGQEVMVSRSIAGRGVGATDNLLVNGGGELGDADDVPPMGWTIAAGPSWSASWLVGMPVEGARIISAGAGPAILAQFTLHQQVGVAPLTTWGDGAGVRFYYRAFHRAETNDNDPTWVELRFLDGSGGQLESHASGQHAGTSWNESVDNFVAPAGTRSVQLVLQCNRVSGPWCSGFFDALEVWGEWLG